MSSARQQAAAVANMTKLESTSAASDAAPAPVTNCGTTTFNQSSEEVGNESL
jgi:hypothetical protein